MTLRTRLLITALWLCHQVPAFSLVTSQLPTENSETYDAQQPGDAPVATPCLNRAATQLIDGTIICAVDQEKEGAIYKLRGDVEIHYRNYVLRADEVTYNSDTDEATGSGHFTIDGGPNDDHIKASHGTYNLAAETGHFYRVSGTTGFHFHGSRAVLTSSAPFAFSGKEVAK